MANNMLHSQNSFKLTWLSGLIIVLMMIGCQKDPRSAGSGIDDMYTINFDLQNATFASSQGNSSLQGQVRQANNLNDIVDYLFFWSFNNETLQPDVAIQPGAQISYNDGLIPASYAAGWPFEDYAAGRALSQTGVREFVVEVPLQVIASFESLGFDISSSATGPKAFDLYYRFADEDWQLLQDNNQFSNFLTSQARNSFTFNLSTLNLAMQERISFQLVTAAGERGSGNAYNENSGALRIDNLRLRGTVKATERTEGDQLHVYAFDQVTGNLTSSVVQDYIPNMPTISMELPHGQYRFSFVRRTGDSDLLLPAFVSSAETYFFTNRFSAYAGEVFGVEKSIFVNQNIRESVSLDRYYSQIKFQFIDAQDLSAVDRVVVVRRGEPLFYAPFNPQMANPVLDQSEIVLMPNFAQSKELQFNQFIGKVDNPVNLSYSLLIYGINGELLRTLEVSAMARNNVQVLFRGELLGDLPFQTSFQITINEEWDEQVEVQF